jgi:hypothetical protein
MTKNLFVAGWCCQLFLEIDGPKFRGWLPQSLNYYFGVYQNLNAGRSEDGSASVIAELCNRNESVVLELREDVRLTHCDWKVGQVKECRVCGLNGAAIG